MAAADPAGALATYLLSQPALAALVADRVFRPELPATEEPSMPRACIVIRRAGGYQLFGADNPPVGDPTIDFFCYGARWLEAEEIAATVVLALRSLRTSTHEQTRLYWARIAGGPNPFEDPKTDWPACVVSAQVAHCELQLA